MPLFPHRCWAEINLSVLEQNVRSIRRRLPPDTTYISVVKADSYGLGTKRTLSALKAGGADLFAVANVAEAAEIRQNDRDTPILLLSATLPQEDDYLFEYNLTPTVSSLEEARRYQAAAARHGRPLPVHLKFDTGMGRLGTWHLLADELINAVSPNQLLQVKGLYSHFASAGEDAEFTTLQRDRFLHSIQRLQAPKNPIPLLVHIDNSSGLATFQAGGPCNAVRVGLLQFGVLPTPDSPLASFGTLPALKLHSRISVVKSLPKGAEISYGRTRILSRDSRVAIVTAGYADGISRACGNRGSVLVRGQRCPILGHVTMDNIVIDATDLPTITCGDQVTIIGQQEADEITIHEYSSWCRTIPWECLCAISRRVARVYP